jgi:ketosteroid isomerase-like protein
VDSSERLTVEATEFIDADDQVAIEFVQRGWSKGSGVAVELRSWAVTTFRDGALARTELFLTRTEALKAAGLSE